MAKRREVDDLLDSLAGPACPRCFHHAKARYHVSPSGEEACSWCYRKRIDYLCPRCHHRLSHSIEPFKYKDRFMCTDCHEPFNRPIAHRRSNGGHNLLYTWLRIKKALGLAF